MRGEEMAGGYDAAAEALRDVLTDLAAKGELSTTGSKGMLAHFSVVVEYLDEDGQVSWAILHHPDDTLRDIVGHATMLQASVDAGYRRVFDQGEER